MNNTRVKNKYMISIVGTGYVGLSMAVFLALHNCVTAVDIVAEKVELINNRKSAPFRTNT